MSAAISSHATGRRSRPAVILTEHQVTEYVIRGLRAEVEDARVRLAKARARVASKRSRRDLDYVAAYERRLANAYRTLDAFLVQIGDLR